MEFDGLQTLLDLLIYYTMGFLVFWAFGYCNYKSPMKADFYWGMFEDKHDQFSPKLV
jgi:hypothetical protein